MYSLMTMPYVMSHDNALCDVASLISEDTVISGTSADDTSTCLSTHEEVDDGFVIHLMM